MIRNIVFFLLAAAVPAMANDDVEVAKQRALTTDEALALAKQESAAETLTETTDLRGASLLDEATEIAARPAHWRASRAVVNPVAKRSRRTYFKIGAGCVAVALAALYLMLGTWISRKMREATAPQIEIASPVLTGPGHASGSTPTPSA